MKTKITFFILIMIMPVVCSCREDVEVDKNSHKFSLIRPDLDAYGCPCQKIRFNTVKEKDAREIAIEKIEEDWNRNLIIGNQSLVFNQDFQ